MYVSYLEDDSLIVLHGFPQVGDLGILVPQHGFDFSDPTVAGGRGLETALGTTPRGGGGRPVRPTPVEQYFSMREQLTTTTTH